MFQFVLPGKIIIIILLEAVGVLRSYCVCRHESFKSQLYRVIVFFIRGSEIGLKALIDTSAVRA